MGNLTKSLIERMKSAKTAEDLEGWVWKTSDLLVKSHFKEYHSGFAEIDDEVVSSDERDHLRSALLEALNRNSEPRFVSPIINALARTRDESLKQLYVDYLARYLRQLKDCNGVVYAALLALSELDEPVYERRSDGSSSQGLTDVDKNMRQASRYLEKHQIIVPW
jgi:hypothetical protein